MEKTAGGKTSKRAFRETSKDDSGETAKAQDAKEIGRMPSEDYLIWNCHGSIKGGG